MKYGAPNQGVVTCSPALVTVGVYNSPEDCEYLNYLVTAWPTPPRNNELKVMVDEEYCIAELVGVQYVADQIGVAIIAFNAKVSPETSNLYGVAFRRGLNEQIWVPAPQIFSVTPAPGLSWFSRRWMIIQQMNLHT